MEKNKVSVIVPIYNVSIYLDKCIESLINQTYKNIEIILVNDGSLDNSLEIMKKYAKIDSRIHIINQTNQGVSVARNNGIIDSVGEYIMFVDGDDYVCTNYVEYFINLIDKYDMGISYNYYDDLNLLPASNDKVDIITSSQCMEEIYLNNIGVAVWNKIYRSDIIKKYNIQFNKDFWFAEGMTFNIEYLSKIKKVIAGNEKCYYQVLNTNSAVRKFKIENYYCGMKAMEYQKNLLNKNNKLLIATWNYHYYRYYYVILKGLFYNDYEEFKKLKKSYRCKIRKSIKYIIMVDLPIMKKIKKIIVALFPILCIKLKKEDYK